MYIVIADHTVVDCQQRQRQQSATSLSRLTVSHAYTVGYQFYAEWAYSSCVYEVLFLFCNSCCECKCV